MVLNKLANSSKDWDSINDRSSTSDETDVSVGASSIFSVVLLFLVIAIGVSVGELSIPMRTVFYAISNKLGMTRGAR